jgi:hypothetical protein
VTFEESFAKSQGNPIFAQTRALAKSSKPATPPQPLNCPRNHGRASGGRRLAGRATTVPTSFQPDARSVHACRGGRSPRQVGSRAGAVSEHGMHARQKDLSGCALSPLFRRSRNLFVGAHMERGQELGGGPTGRFLRRRLIFSSVSARRWPHACPARDRSTPLAPRRRGILGDLRVFPAYFFAAPATVESATRRGGMHRGAGAPRVPRITHCMHALRCVVRTTPARPRPCPIAPRMIPPTEGCHPLITISGVRHKAVKATTLPLGSLPPSPPLPSLDTLRPFLLLLLLLSIRHCLLTTGHVAASRPGDVCLGGGWRMSPVYVFQHTKVHAFNAANPRMPPSALNGNGPRPPSSSPSARLSCAFIRVCSWIGLHACMIADPASPEDACVPLVGAV